MNVNERDILYEFEDKKPSNTSFNLFCHTKLSEIILTSQRMFKRFVKILILKHFKCIQS